MLHNNKYFTLNKVLTFFVVKNSCNLKTKQLQNSYLCSRTNNNNFTMVIDERTTRVGRLRQVAEQMMTAARTAPKGKGVDIMEIALVEGDTIHKLSDEMLKYSQKTGLKFITRDAENILNAEAIVLIGTKTHTHGLNCRYCGFDTCEEKLRHEAVPCTINSVDVGIAVGAACSVAADCRVDNRVMFSVGRVVQEMGLMSGCSSIFGIPISCTSKNPFFDRISKTPPSE